MPDTVPPDPSTTNHILSSRLSSDSFVSASSTSNLTLLQPPFDPAPLLDSAPTTVAAAVQLAPVDATATASASAAPVPVDGSHPPDTESDLARANKPSSSRRRSLRLPLLTRNSSARSIFAPLHAARRSPSLSSLGPLQSRAPPSDLQARDCPEDQVAPSVNPWPQTQKRTDPASVSHTESTPGVTLHAFTDVPTTTTTTTVPSLAKRGEPSRHTSDQTVATSNPAKERPTSEETSKMHQTSSRLLRMTDDDRPFTSDFKDLFATLMVSLPLTPHRVKFSKIDHTFTSEEAVTNLGSLKFSQSNRMPDPKDPTRIVTTTTTTTFSMAKEMARSVCMKFLEAKFIESVDGKMDFSNKGAVWQLTPKGIHILELFCSRNGIQQSHVKSLTESSRNPRALVVLEREPETDRLSHDQGTIEILFRRFAGIKANSDSSAAMSDTDSIHDFANCNVGVKMAPERKFGDKTYSNVFSGRAAAEWLMDCCTMVDKREAAEICSLFLQYGLMAPCEAYRGTSFQAGNKIYYHVTPKGERVAGWVSTPHGSASGEGDAFRARDGITRDSNASRMAVIIKDPALRLLFREFLKESHCEENLSFYLEVRQFLSNFHNAKKANATPRVEVIRETLAAAYSLYNAFLAPGSPNELNIDHSLRISLASRMTRAVGDDEAMIQSLEEVAKLFDEAQHSVFKLMASDSVPKFVKHPRYAPQLRDRNLESAFGSSPAARPS